MSAEINSIFDLSPAEKLQLVEDLWDDWRPRLLRCRFMTGKRLS
jgi:hypothetical protein